uniref:Reverse transcriptase Ty1/copia-type domain-containing protein n=1 Tax=Physcomitrium patens TaxID=3218 RepID=A0A2K1JBF0_PHYPA|nr:hypothetical protein PHYPA_019137 [Physcomitrium patens]
MIEHPKLIIDSGKEEVDPILYRRYVGKLIQLIHICYDICLAVGLLHQRGVKQIRRYLNRIRNHGILFVKGEQLAMVGHVDFDYAGDRANGSSTTGFVFQQGTSSTLWHSKCQLAVALSSTKSAIKLAYNLILHQHTKHISKHYHYSREKIESK